MITSHLVFEDEGLKLRALRIAAVSKVTKERLHSLSALFLLFTLNRVVKLIDGVLHSDRGGLRTCGVGGHLTVSGALGILLVEVLFWRDVRAADSVFVPPSGGTSADLLAVDNAFPFKGLQVVPDLVSG